MDTPIYASLMIDDPPANATYWARLQQFAMGYVPADRGEWGRNWRALEPAAWFRPEDAIAFAEMAEEFGVRGKFSFLPCPAGLGRIDQHVRGYDDAKLQQLVAVVRDRIAGPFDISSEVLTHSMTLDVKTMGLLPHAESAWMTHMCVTRQIDAVHEYLLFGYRILNNAGIPAHGVSIGGMDDVSGIAQGKGMQYWDGCETLGEVLLSVEREIDASIDTTFVFTGMKPRSEASTQWRVPDPLYAAPAGGRAYAMHTASEDVVFPVMHGPTPEKIERVTDALITRDLSDGLLVREAEAGRVVAISAHAQTLNAMNTGAGIQILREAFRRFHERYGRRIVWQNCRELCTRFPDGKS